MNLDAAHKNGWEIAEVVFGVPFLLAITLHLVTPFPLSQGILRQVLLPAGIALIVAGVGFIVSARREFSRYGQPTDPGRATSKVIKTGVFSVSRNPLYLGSVLVFLGFALALNMLWALVALPISMIFCHYRLVVPEEKYLAAKFGTEYEEYCSSVHRWLGRKLPAKA